MCARYSHKLLIRRLYVYKHILHTRAVPDKCETFVLGKIFILISWGISTIGIVTYVVNFRMAEGNYLVPHVALYTLSKWTFTAAHTTLGLVTHFIGCWTRLWLPSVL